MSFLHRRGIFWIKLFLLSVVFLLFLLFVIPKGLSGFAVYLVRSDDVRPCDAIVVLSGDRGERLAEGVRLYHQGIAPVMFITGGPIYSTSHPQLMKNEAVKEGVPSDVILEEKSFSTRDHPRQLRAYFDVMNIQSVVLVTSQFHTRRSCDSFSDFYEIRFLFLQWVLMMRLTMVVMEIT